MFLHVLAFNGCSIVSYVLERTLSDETFFQEHGSTGRGLRNTYGGNPSHLDLMNGMPDGRKEIRFTVLPSPVLMLGFPEDFYWHEHIHLPFKCGIPILLLIPQLSTLSSKSWGY